jgi:hypothetical protein
VKLDWAGAVALVLALALGTCVVAIVLDLTLTDSHISEQGAQLLGTLLGGMLGAVATYLGYSVRATPPRPRRDADSDGSGRGPS